jgi:hypothetical protein
MSGHRARASIAGSRVGGKFAEPKLRAPTYRETETKQFGALRQCTTSYLEDAVVVLTVHWIANPTVPIGYTVYRTVCYLLVH